MKKKLLKYLQIGLILAVVLIAGGVITVTVFEDEVKTFALEKLESQLNSKMDVGQVELTLLSKFPLASIEIHDVWIEDTMTPGDTLLQAEKLYLSFSPLGFIRNEYRIQRIDLENGLVQIKESRTQANYKFWKSSNKKDGAVNFDLSILKLKNITALYQNSDADVFTKNLIYDLELKGDIKGDLTKLSWEGELLTNGADFSGLKGLEKEQIEIEGSFVFDRLKRTLNLQEVNIKIDGAELFWNGWIDVSDNITLLKAEILGEDIWVSDVNRIFPDLLKDLRVNYEIDARIDFSGELKGQAGSGYFPEIKIHTEIDRGYLLHRSSRERLDDINSKGEFSFTKEQGWLYKSLSTDASFRKGEFHGTGLVADGEVPFLDLEVNGNADLTELGAFLAWDTLEVFKGDVELAAKWKGELPNWKPDLNKLNEIEMSGNILISDAVVKIKGDPHEVTNIQAELLLDGNDVTIQQLSGALGESDFELRGLVNNYLGYLTSTDQILSVEASLHSGRIMLEDIFVSSSDANHQDGSVELQLPENLKARINMDIGNLTFRDFEASNIKGIALLSDGVLELNPVSMDCAEGEFRASLSLKPDRINENYVVSSSGSLTGMNVSQLFYYFGNFGQKVITDRHIRGIANADVRFTASVSKDMVVDRKSVNSVVDVAVNEGELIGLESLTGISDYLRGNRLISSFVEVEEFDRKLRHVKFSTLNNTVEIYDEQIHFPKMEIASSAMDISASGSHSFDNKIDYSVMFRIRDVLRKRKSQFGETEDDGLGSRFYLAMKGTVDNPEFTYDREARRAQRKEDIQTEKRKFKELLKEEFGLFKKDKELDGAEENTAAKTNTEEEEVEISVEWSETESDTLKSEESKKKKSLWDRITKEDDQEEWVPDDDDDDF